MGPGKTVGPGQDWTGKCGSWMGSLSTDLFASVDKISFRNNLNHLMRLSVVIGRLIL